jgi:hypothetical protein
MDIREFLSSVAPYASLAEEIRRDLLETLKCRGCQAGEVLIACGRAGTCMGAPAASRVAVFTPHQTPLVKRWCLFKILRGGAAVAGKMPPTARMPRPIRKAVAFIDTHYETAITIDPAFREVGMRHSSFSRPFRQFEVYCPSPHKRPGPGGLGPMPGFIPSAIFDQRGQSL